MKIIIISDFLPSEVLGGAEINNLELHRLLESRGYEVQSIKSSDADATPFFIERNKYNFFVVSNFIALTRKSIEALKSCAYLIYEHDHKYLRSRNPADYVDFKAPKEELINIDFYKKARVVLCQSTFHKDIVELNTGLGNVESVGGNLWSTESLDFMEKLVDSDKKGLRFYNEFKQLAQKY